MYLTLSWRAMVTAIFATAMIALLPFSSNAMTVEVDTLESGIEDRTEEIFTGEEEDEEAEGSSLFAFDVPEVGGTHTFTFTADECPAILLTLGALVDVENTPWTCDEETGAISVTAEHTGFIPGSFEMDEDDSELEEGEEHGDDDMNVDNLLVIAMSPVAEVEGTGPGDSEKGMTLCTNVLNWEMEPPSPDNISFGFSLTGPFATTGYMRFFMPQGTIDNLSGHAGEELTAEDLAVFNDGNQSSMAVTEITGGALVDISVLFVPAVSATTVFTGLSTETRMITKTLSAGQPQDISLAAKKTRLKKGRMTTMYGWVQGANEGDKVRIDRGRKKKKVKRYKKCIEKASEGENAGKCIERKKKYRTTTVRNDNGYYKFKVKATKKGWWFRTSAKVNGERVFSEKVQVKAKKSS